MEIYLVRHGAAHTKEDDPERHLNNNGLNQCRLTGKALNRLDITFDLVISSPKARARQTAEIIADEVGYQKNEIKVTETLEPTASPKDTISYLNNFADKKRLMLAGHLPLLGNLASELLSRNSQISLYFEAGAVCQIDVDQPISYTGIFRWFLTPEQLRLIAQA
ncbi:MAG: phosphohistidine phosphatase SixA [Planctomycetota bacterium]